MATETTEPRNAKSETDVDIWATKSYKSCQLSQNVTNKVLKAMFFQWSDIANQAGYSARISPIFFAIGESTISPSVITPLLSIYKKNEHPIKTPCKVEKLTNDLKSTYSKEAEKHNL